MVLILSCASSLVVRLILCLAYSSPLSLPCRFWPIRTTWLQDSSYCFGWLGYAILPSWSSFSHSSLDAHQLGVRFISVPWSTINGLVKSIVWRLWDVTSVPECIFGSGCIVYSKSMIAYAALCTSSSIFIRCDLWTPFIIVPSSRASLVIFVKWSKLASTASRSPTCTSYSLAFLLSFFVNPPTGDCSRSSKIGDTESFLISTTLNCGLTTPWTIVHPHCFVVVFDRRSI